jgi:hypothetical protein
LRPHRTEQPSREKSTTAKKPGAEKWSLPNRRAVTESPPALDRRRGQAGTENRWLATKKNNRAAETGKTRSRRTETEDRIVTDYSTQKKQKKTVFALKNN